MIRKQRASNAVSVESYIEKLQVLPVTRVLIQSLAVELRTQQVSWVDEFIKKQGIYHLAAALANVNATMNKREIEYLIQSDAVNCFYSILNLEEGFHAFLNTDEALNTLVMTLFDSKGKSKATILLLLAVVCKQEEQNSNIQGCDMVVSALHLAKLIKREPHLLHNLVQCTLGLAPETLQQSTATTADSLNLDSEYRVNVLMFFNVLLSMSDTKTFVELRKLWLEMNLVDKLKKLEHVQKNPDFIAQLKLFQEQLSDDTMDFVHQQEQEILQMLKNIEKNDLFQIKQTLLAVLKILDGYVYTFGF